MATTMLLQVTINSQQTLNVLGVSAQVASLRHNSSCEYICVNNPSLMSLVH